MKLGRIDTDSYYMLKVVYVDGFVKNTSFLMA